MELFSHPTDTWKVQNKNQLLISFVCENFEKDVNVYRIIMHISVPMLGFIHLDDCFVFIFASQSKTDIRFVVIHITFRLRQLRRSRALLAGLSIALYHFISLGFLICLHLFLSF